MCVDQPQADSEDQDSSVQRLCHQHTALRERGMDHLRQAGKATEYLPHENPSPHPWDIVAGQGAQH